MDRQGAVSEERKPAMPKAHPPYDEEFRRNAVELLMESRRPLKRVADELGLSANALRSWRDRLLGKGRVAQAGESRDSGTSGRSAASLAIADPAAEIRRLQRENDYLRRQREILKKAVSILSEDPQSGMR